MNGEPPRPRGLDKLPRIDFRKLTRGDVAARRETVALLGDALRERGGVRIEGHGITPPGDTPPAALAQVGVLAALADHLLEALAEYFGLPGRSFVDAAGATASSAGAVALAGALPAALLVLLPAPPERLELRGGLGTWSPAAARPGEMVALPGGALAALTADVVPKAAVRWAGEEAVRALVIGAGEGVALPALPGFGAGR